MNATDSIKESESLLHKSSLNTLYNMNVEAPQYVDTGQSPDQSPDHDASKTWWKIITTRVREMAKNLTAMEISGSLGDLGTFIPLTIALAKNRTIYIAPTLFFAGLSNLMTGCAWDVPMPVQPMKSIAAVAISELWTPQQIATSGITVGAIVFLLGLTNIMEVINWIIPLSVVSGMQIGLGLRLMSTGMTSVVKLGVWVGNNGDCILLALLLSICVLYWLREPPLNWADKQHASVHTSGDITTLADEEHSSAIPSSPTNTLAATCFNKVRLIVCCCIPSLSGAKYSSNEDDAPPPHPVGVYLFACGCCLAVFKLAVQHSGQITWFRAPVAVWALADVTPNDWKVGLFEGALPQIPLTTLNSVISVCALCTALFPNKVRAITPENSSSTATSSESNQVISRRTVTLSVGLLNLVLCPFGSMPNCHGAGGLAGQYRFGARSGTSVAFLGICKMSIALVLGANVVTFLDAFPSSVIAVMIACAGAELAVTGWTMMTQQHTPEIISKQWEIVVNTLNTTTTSSSLSDSKLSDLKRQFSKSLIRQDVFVAIVTASVMVGLGRTDYGVVAGWIAHIIYADGWRAYFSLFSRIRRRARRGRGGGLL